MAQVTLGIGTSHSPMLSTPHEAHPHLAEPVAAGSCGCLGRPRGHGGPARRQGRLDMAPHRM
jgi:hypothetical protein